MKQSANTYLINVDILSDITQLNSNFLMILNSIASPTV